MDTNYFRDWKTLGKRRSENQIIGESGIDILRSLFPKEWVIREYTADYGIDLDVELFEECNDGVYVTKGEHVLFQVKTTNDIEVKDLEVYSKTKSDNCIFKVVKYPLDTALLATVEKMGSAVPVLLCLVDNVERDEYYLHYYSDFKVTDEVLRRNTVLPQNRIGETCTEHEVNFVCRREDGSYVSSRTMQHVSRIVHEQLTCT